MESFLPFRENKTRTNCNRREEEEGGKPGPCCPSGAGRCEPSLISPRAKAADRAGRVSRAAGPRGPEPPGGHEPQGRRRPWAAATPPGAAALSRAQTWGGPRSTASAARSTAPTTRVRGAGCPVIPRTLRAGPPLACPMARPESGGQWCSAATACPLTLPGPALRGRAESVGRRAPARPQQTPHPAQPFLAGHLLL